MYATLRFLVHGASRGRLTRRAVQGKSVSKEKYEERLGQMKALVEEHDELLVKLCSLFIGDDTPNVSQWRDEGIVGPVELPVLSSSLPVSRSPPITRP